MALKIVNALLEASFQSIKKGGIFIYGRTGFMKLELTVTIPERVNTRANAICLESGNFAFFGSEDEVYPVPAGSDLKVIS